MPTTPVPNLPMELGCPTPTSNDSSKKRKAEGIPLSPSSSHKRVSSHSATTGPTKLRPPPLNLSPHNNATPLSSRIQHAIHTSFHQTGPDIIRNSRFGFLKDYKCESHESSNIDETSSCNSSRHVSSTRSVTESDISQDEDASEEIQQTTTEINDSVQARKWLFFIEHQLHKLLHELIQIERASAEVAKITNSRLVFSDNVYHLREQILLFHMCQQHKVEETRGEEAFLKLKLGELQQLSVGSTDSNCNGRVYRSPEEVNTSICRALFTA